MIMKLIIYSPKVDAIKMMTKFNALECHPSLQQAIYKVPQKKIKKPFFCIK